MAVCWLWRKLYKSKEELACLQKKWAKLWPMKKYQAYLLIFDFRLPAFSQNYNHPCAEKTMLIQNIFRDMTIFSNEIKYSTNQIVCTKYRSKCYTFNNFFACQYFCINFPLLHKYFKHQDQIHIQTLPMISRSPASAILNAKNSWHGFP